MGKNELTIGVLGIEGQISKECREGISFNEELTLWKLLRLRQGEVTRKK